MALTQFVDTNTALTQFVDTNTTLTQFVHTYCFNIQTQLIPSVE
jgi:hypothetical protein